MFTECVWRRGGGCCCEGNSVESDAPFFFFFLSYCRIWIQTFKGKLGHGRTEVAFGLFVNKHTPVLGGDGFVQ